MFLIWVIKLIEIFVFPRLISDFPPLANQSHKEANLGEKQWESSFSACEKSVNYSFDKASNSWETALPLVELFLSMAAIWKQPPGFRSDKGKEFN